MVLLPWLCLVFAIVPGFHEPLGEIATGLDKERSRAASHVANLEVQQFPGRTELPFLLGLALGGAFVHQRLQGVLDNRFRKAAWRVVGATRTPLGPRRDKHAPRTDNHRLAERIVADQASKRQDAPEQSLL